jgi:hypothetical protein
MTGIVMVIINLSKIKDLTVRLDKNLIETGENLSGCIEINYAGRFDSVVINSQIEYSSDVFNYINVNGKKITHPYARLSLLKQEIPQSREIEFTITTSHVPPNFTSNAKLRVSLIQEHKEIITDVTHFRITRNTPT